MTVGRNGSRPWEDFYPEKLRSYEFDLKTMPDHVADIISAAAVSYGTRSAFTVVQPDGRNESLSFEETERLSDAFAGFLEISLGLSIGDVLAVKLSNSLTFPIVVYGAWKAGLIVTPVNPFYTAVETEHQLLDSGAKVVVAETAMVDQLRAKLPTINCISVARSGRPLADVDFNEVQQRAVGQWEIGQTLSHAAKPSGRRHATALYQYTGGTTGRSKGAIITSANLLATSAIVRDFFAGFGSPIAQGTALTALPLYHIFAFLFGMLVYVEAGTRNVIVPMPRPVSNLRPAFIQFAIDWMAGVDTLYAGLLAEPWFRTAPPQLHFAIAGGAALRSSVTTEWEALVGPLVEGYGLTESTGIASCNPPTAARRNGSVGLPVPGCDIRIIDQEGRDVATGDSGELLIRGANIAAGYLGSLTPDGFEEGWLRTGDIAAFDPAGMLVIRDRSKDMLLPPKGLTEPRRFSR